MRRRALIPALAVMLVACWQTVSPAVSQAAPDLSFVTCPNNQAFTCGALNVPVDRRGALPGTIPLSVERKVSGAQPSSVAVLALAGGPGQATLPLAEFIAQAIAPGL